MLINEKHFIWLQEVCQLEVLCKQLYESQDANQMSEAEKALVNFQNSSDRLEIISLTSCTGFHLLTLSNRAVIWF
jgi:hypothetical protein